MMKTIQNAGFKIRPGRELLRFNYNFQSKTQRLFRSKSTTNKPKVLSKGEDPHQPPGDLAAATSTGVSSNRQASGQCSYDLLHAAARLGALEERIGYVFNDKLLGLKALKPGGNEVAITFEDHGWDIDGRRDDIDGHRRLALLGDRALDLALCQTWYKSGQSRFHYARRESRLVTRSALAKTGYKLRLESSLLAKFLARDTIAEAFEALIGAVYVDSSYNLQKVEDVLDTINFENVQIPIQDAAPSESDTNKETRLKSDATLESQSALPANAECEGMMNVTDHKRESTPNRKQKRKLKQQTMLEQRNALQSQKTVDKICSPTDTSAPEAQATDISSAGSLSVLDPSFESISDPSFDFRNIYQEGWLRDDIRKRIVMFEKKTIHRCNIVTSILSSLLRPLEFGGQYWLSLVLHPEERKTSEMKELDAQQRCDMFWNSMFGSNEKKVERVSRSPRAHAHLTDQFRRITGKDSFQWSEGNLFQHLCEAGLQPRDAFLAACRIEDEVRGIARNEMGLPDWYDLPEQQDKILPPWRMAKEPGVASEEVETVAEWWKSSEPGYSFLQDESAQKEQDTEEAQKVDSTPEDGSPEDKQSWDPIRPTTQEQHAETLPDTATAPDDTTPTPKSRPHKPTAQDNALPLPPPEPVKQDIPPPAFQRGNLDLSNPPPNNPQRSTTGGEDLDNPSERSKIEEEQREEAGEQGETLAQAMNKDADTHIDGAEEVPKEERGQESYLKRLLRTILGRNNV